MCVSNVLCRLAMLGTIALTLAAAGCSTPSDSGGTPQQRFAKPIETEADGLNIALVGILAAGHPDTLVEDPGWREYLLSIENWTDTTVVVRNVKLLNSEGRYLDSAGTYAEINAPPGATEKVATGVARSTAGVVAGQLIPFGGYLVSVVSTAASAAAASSTGNAPRDFGLRKLKEVELAPAGRVFGSAFLPNILDPDAVVVDYVAGRKEARAELRLPKPGGAP
jgi:hypothetical protein